MTGARPHTGNWSAELLMFSGLPNPTWELSDSEQAVVNEKLREMRLKPQPPGIIVQRCNIGYSGIYLMDPSVPSLSPPSVFVYAEVVTIEADNKSYVDSEGLEAYLITLSRLHEPDLITDRGLGFIAEQYNSRTGHFLE